MRYRCILMPPASPRSACATRIARAGRMRVIAAMAVCVLLGTGGCERDPLPPDIPDVIAPIAPAQLRYESNTDGAVLLEWRRNGEPDLDHYEIHRSEEGTPDSVRIIASTTNFWHVDRALSYDTAYTYFVTAVDRSGNRSAPSNSVRLTSPNTYTPWEPDDAFAVAQNDETGPRILVSWTPSDDDDIARYRIYRSALVPITVPDPALLLAETEQLSHVDRHDLALNLTYHYLVTAVDRGGLESEKAAEASDRVLDVPLLELPVDGAFLPSFGTFSWRHVGAASYRLVVSHAGGASQIWAGTVVPGGEAVVSMQYTGPGLEAGRIYSWRVVAYTKSGEQPNSVSPARSFQVR